MSTNLTFERPKIKGKLILGIAALVAFLCGFPFTSQADEPNNQIILSAGGMVMVTVNNLVTNACSGSTGLSSPQEIELFTDFNNMRGESVTIGPFSAGEELIFYLSPWNFCGGYTYLSTDPTHAHVTPLDVPNSWRIDWEDVPDHLSPDNDFNDLIIIIRLVGVGTPDFKQDNPDWADDPYDHLPGATIGNRGSSVTSAANLIHYYGAYDVNPETLDNCLSSETIKGYNRSGVINWRKVGLCSNPNYPHPEPFFIKFVQKLNEGELFVNPTTGKLEAVTENRLKELADEDLAKGWPVIFEVPHPLNPSGVHYVVATGKEGDTYTINDPWCGDWPICTDAGLTLTDYQDELLSIVRFAPSDGQFRPSLTINGSSPMEFIVTDPLGRKTGYSLDGLRFAEIPNADYRLQRPIADYVTGEIQNEGLVEFYLFEPMPGVYRVSVTRPGNGNYSLAASYHPAPFATYESEQSGMGGGGSIEIYNLHIAPDSTPTWENITSRVYLPLVISQ